MSNAVSNRPGSQSSLMDGLEEFASKPKKSGGSSGPGSTGMDKKQVALLVAAVLGLAGAAFFSARYLFGGVNIAEETRLRTVICSETGEVFRDYRLPLDSTYPWQNPSTGNNSLFPAEPCYWTSDGKAKKDPTWVLLNDYVGKPGQTQCPDCGRRVVGHNPEPPVRLMMEAFNYTPPAEPGR